MLVPAPVEGREGRASSDLRYSGVGEESVPGARAATHDPYSVPKASIQEWAAVSSKYIG